MILNSPHYEGLSIYVAEKPIAGSFYCPKSSDTLSYIANWAYGAGTLPLVLRINKSAWNRANCVYRKNSTKCSSSKVPSALALSQNSFADGAWLALCQSDKQSWAASLGLNYPVFWVPGPNGEEPEDLATKPQVPIPGVVFTPGVPGAGTAVFTPGVTDVPGTAEFTPGFVDDVPGVESEKSYLPWIIGGALLLAAAGGGYYLYKRKGR